MDPDDAEVLAYLDSELGTEDGSEPEEQRHETEEPEEPGRREQSFHGDGFEDDEEDDDDSEDDDELDDEDDGEDLEDGEDGDELPEDDKPQLDPGEARLKAIAEAVAQKQKEALQAIKAQGVKQKIDAIKAASTDEEFAAFEKKLMTGFAMHIQKQRQEKGSERDMVLASIGIAQRLEQEAREDSSGREMAIVAAEQNHLPRLSVAERAALEATPPDRFVATVQRLAEARSKQTEPARQALREKRQSKRADSAPLRENGGARAVRGDYNNYDDIGSYLDDVFAGM